MVYATISLAIVMLFSAGYKKIKQGNAIPIWGSALILCLFAGLRDISFGPDLLAYKSRYLNSIPLLSYAEILSQYRSGMIKDGLFYVIMKFFINIGASYQLFIAFITSFYVISVTVLIAKESEKPIISFLMFFTLSWFQFSFTGLRQSLAMAMCTVALTLLINNRRDVTATALIVIAGFVHSSAWIFLIAPIIARLDLKIGKIQFLLMTGISLILSILGAALFRRVIVSIAWNETLADYAASDVSLNWTGFIIQLLFAAVSYVFYDDAVRDRPEISFLYSLMAIGLAFQAFSSVVAEMFRVSMYFSIASICVYPEAIMSMRRKDCKSIACYLSILFLVFYFFKAEKFAMYIPMIS